MKTPGPEKLINIAIGLTAFAVFCLLAYYYGTLIGYALVAVVLSYILDPIVNRLQAAGMNRTLAVCCTLSALIVMLIWVSTNIIPRLANQMVALASQFNLETLQDIAAKIEHRLSRELTFLPDKFLQNNLTQAFEGLLDIGQLPATLSNIIGVFTNIFSAILIIPFTTFFFLKDGSRIRRNLLRWIPNKYFEISLGLIDKIEDRLGSYFQSVMLESIFVALASWLLLAIVGLDNALSVGIVIGIANTIPYLGPIIGYFLSIIVSIIEVGNFSMVLPCIVAIFVVQIIDNFILQPFLFSRSADLHPVAILFLILIGAQTAGILGMLVAVPIATTVKITINQIQWSLDNYHVFSADTR